jgi:hypothetical protein
MGDEQATSPPTIDTAVADFWQEYWKITERQAPQLRMPKPRKSVRAGLVQFDPLGFPSVRLIHKVEQGCVDLEFPGFGRRLEGLHSVYGMSLEQNMSIRQAGGSGAIRVLVDVIDPKLPFAEQSGKVSAAIGNAQALLTWFYAQTQLGRKPPT